MHCIGGILPAITGDSSIVVLLLGRFAFGIGYGLMQGICISMSFKLVTDERLRESSMGWALTAQYATNMVAQVVVGYLCLIKWNYSFYIYAWSLIPFLVVLFCAPSSHLTKKITLGWEAMSTYLRRRKHFGSLSKRFHVQFGFSPSSSVVICFATILCFWSYRPLLLGAALEPLSVWATL